MFESVGTKTEKCDKAQVTGHEHFRQTLCVLRGECVHSCKYDSVLVYFLKQFTMKGYHFFKIIIIIIINKYSKLTLFYNKVFQTHSFFMGFLLMLFLVLLLHFSEVLSFILQFWLFYYILFSCLINQKQFNICLPLNKKFALVKCLRRKFKPTTESKI